MRAFDPGLVRQTMKQRGISQVMLAEALGFPGQSAISALLSGKRRVTVDEAAGIYRFLGLDSPASAVEPASVRAHPAESSAALDGYGIVPVIGIAGAGRWREAVELPQGFMPVPGRLAGPGVFGIEVCGDSMDLLIEDGGLILVDPMQKELAPGSVYLIANSRAEATVKRYRRDPARFEPCSSNPDYRPFLVSEDDFSVLGKIVWKSAPVI